MNAEAAGALKAALLARLDAHPYRPPWWLRNAHAQTFFGPLFRGRGALPRYRRERWTTPDDDFLDLYMLDAAAGAPRLLLLHGLEGSIESFYCTTFNRRFHAQGWAAATMEFRSCGGEINRAPRMYHMGETSDLDFVVRRLRAADPAAPLCAVGISLGGNVLAKWLGERGEEAVGLIDAAACISPPFDPLVSAPDFHRILWGFYAWRFLRTLVPKALAKATQYPERLDADAIRRARDFYDFDTHATARLHGYADAEDYWRQVGCHQYLGRIRVPTLLLTSADDPFNPASTIPRAAADASPWLVPQWTARGGHAGFVPAAGPCRADGWAEAQCLRFFEGCLAR